MTYLAESWKGSTFTRLQHGDLSAEVWSTVEPLIEHALAYAFGLITTSDVLDGFADNNMQIWLCWHEGEIEAVVVTEIEQHPGGKVCNFIAVAGENRDNWLEFEAIITAWAAAEGAKEHRAIGRTGWQRAAPGWRYAGTIIRKPIDGNI
jgi:hypothetical protein